MTLLETKTVEERTENMEFLDKMEWMKARILALESTLLKVLEPLHILSEDRVDRHKSVESGLFPYRDQTLGENQYSVYRSGEGWEYPTYIPSSQLYSAGYTMADGLEMNLGGHVDDRFTLLEVIEFDADDDSEIYRLTLGDVREAVGVLLEREPVRVVGKDYVSQNPTLPMPYGFVSKPLEEPAPRPISVDPNTSWWSKWRKWWS